MSLWIHKDVVEKFLSDLANLPPGNDSSYAKLENIIAPVLEGERNLRMTFATTSLDLSIVSDPYIGLIDIFSILPTPVIIGRDRTGANLDSTHLFPFLDFDHPLRLPGGKPAVVSLGRFHDNWDIFTVGLLRDMDWSNVVAAGGAVLACVKSTIPEDMKKMEMMEIFQSDVYAGSDIDLFLYSLSPEEVSCHVIPSSDQSPESFTITSIRNIEAKIKMQYIENHVRDCALFPTVCVRKSHTISIHSAF